ncbi:Uncharacterised protein [Shigella sonnei]|nr:Uncharacterised protein [Shigella sonnei]
MQVAGAARSGADRQFSAKLCFSASGKGRHFFVAGGHPLDGAHAIKTVTKTVQRVACDSPDAFHPCRFECFGDISCNRLFHGSPSPECDNGNKFSSSDGGGRDGRERRH